MVSMVIASLFFPFQSFSPAPWAKPSNDMVVMSKITRPNSSSFRGMHIKSIAQDVPKMNETKVDSNKDKLVFRQNFLIRSYEIGPTRTVSIETLMNYLQETANNQARSSGLLTDGYSASIEMIKMNLIPVIVKMQLLVEHYPSGADTIQVDTWVSPCGKNGWYQYWVVRDCYTDQTIVRATSVWVMMNKLTRRISRIPEETRGNLGLYFMEHNQIMDEDSRKLPKLSDDTADYVKRGLTPRWSDLDAHKHVNNVKYISLILESVPMGIHESHELARMKLEYHRECGKDSVLQSLTVLSKERSAETEIECEHMLQLECGAQVMSARTEWRPKGAPGLTGPSSSATTSHLT